MKRLLLLSIVIVSCQAVDTGFLKWNGVYLSEFYTDNVSIPYKDHDFSWGNAAYSWDDNVAIDIKKDGTGFLYSPVMSYEIKVMESKENECIVEAKFMGSQKSEASKIVIKEDGVYIQFLPYDKNDPADVMKFLNNSGDDPSVQPIRYRKVYGLTK
jgi:hypothetical protein